MLKYHVYPLDLGTIFAWVLFLITRIGIRAATNDYLHY